jgi:hypothetical protein
MLAKFFKPIDRLQRRHESLNKCCPKDSRGTPGSRSSDNTTYDRRSGRIQGKIYE